MTGFDRWCAGWVDMACGFVAVITFGAWDPRWDMAFYAWSALRCSRDGLRYRPPQCADRGTQAELEALRQNSERYRLALEDVLSYVLNKDDLYANGALRQIAEDALGEQ